MNATNLDAFAPGTVKVAGNPAPAEKNTGGGKASGMFGTLVFSHSVTESDTTGDRSVSRDSKIVSLPIQDAMVGDSNV